MGRMTVSQLYTGEGNVWENDSNTKLERPSQKARAKKKKGQRITTEGILG